MPGRPLPDHSLSRRRFLRGSVGMALAAILAACSGKATTTPAPAATALTTTTGSASSTVPPTATTANTVAPARPSIGGSSAAATERQATAPVASGAASPATRAQEVTFTSDADTIYGTLLLPGIGQGQKLPAAVILAGSGPTDRDGNSKEISGPVDTLRNFADALAGQGIASLRYDKLGSGKTGLASITNPADIGFDLFVAEVQAASAFLRTRPEIDPRRMIFLGHSEGGLIALVVADQLKGSSDAPEALVLAAPPGFPYLETIQRQFTDQYTQAQQAGKVTKGQADNALMELSRVIANLKQTGKVPADITTPALKQIFSPTNEKFLAEAEAYDPRQIAATLPPTLPVLVLHSAKDQQVGTADVQNLMQGFQTAGNTKAMLVELPDVDHVFKEVPGMPNPATDYGNPALHFSSEAMARLAIFTKANV
ncbi:MAG: alpha/beta hydrolase family protein [Thermomicrobiales bacterium]